MQDGKMSDVPSAPPAYGEAQGYSEDYGAPSMRLRTHAAAAAADSTTAVLNENFTYQNNGNGAAAADGTPPVNPFTQQQYQEKSTNPFARK